MTRSPWQPALARTHIDALRHMPGALLPILHALQAEFGYVDEAAVPMLADALNLSRADIHGVISFYHDFRRSPPGHHVIQICRAEACQARGCDRLVQHARGRLGIDFHQTTADGRFTLEPVFCLGHCANGPAVTVDGQPHARMNAAGFDRLLADPLEAGR